eukprot:5517641-Prymnesium_polylepis.1
MLASELAAVQAPPPPVGARAAWAWPSVGWLSAVLILGGCALVPHEGLGRVDREAAIISFFAPMWALLLVATGEAPQSTLCRALSHPFLTSVGAYSFAVYASAKTRPQAVAVMAAICRPSVHPTSRALSVSDAACPPP